MTDCTDVLTKSLEFIKTQGRYCTALEISKNLKISLFSLYSNTSFDVPRLNKECGFTRKTGKFKNADEIEHILLNYIRDKNRFVPALEIANCLKISRATIIKYGIDMDELNESLGFYRPYEKSINSHNKLSETYIEEVRNKIKLELSKGYLPKHTVCKKLNIPCNKGGVFKYINYNDIVKDCKLEHRGVQRLLSTEELRTKCKDIIRVKGRYCPENILSTELGIAGSSLAFRNIKIVDLNEELGFRRDNFSFEAEVGNTLKTMFPDVTITAQKWFKDLKSSSGRALFFDFFIEELSICVEADGPCHTDTNHPWFSEKVVFRDNLKNKYCQEKGWKLVRIPYINKVTVEYVSSCFLEVP